MPFIQKRTKLPKKVNGGKGRCVFTPKSCLYVSNKIQIGASLIILYKVGIINDLNEAKATKCSVRHEHSRRSDGEQIHSRHIMFTTKARSNISYFRFLNPANTGSRVWLASRFPKFWASVEDCEYFGPQPAWPHSIRGQLRWKRWMTVTAALTQCSLAARWSVATRGL